MNWYSVVLSLLLLISATGARAQGNLGGCADGEEMGYVTVTQPDTLQYWKASTADPKGGDSAVSVKKGDKLRLCRYEGSEKEKAVVTIWAHGVGYMIPTESIDSPQELSLREVTKEDVACVGREIEGVLSENEGDKIGWEMIKLARKHDLSLAMMEKIKNTMPGDLFGGGWRTGYDDIPPCSEFK
jgi:hypothetical protein